KNNIVLLYLMLTFASIKAQQIIPIEDLGNHKYQGGKISDETYFKDVNNLFNHYKGIWVGTYNNNSYVININKIVKDDFLNYNADRLIMKFQIKNDNGQVIRSTEASQVENVTQPASGLGFDRINAKEYKFSYSGPNKDSACGDGGIITLESKNNGSELH